MAHFSGSSVKAVKGLSSMMREHSRPSADQLLTVGVIPRNCLNPS